MKETIIKVSGMECSGCENRIKNALSAIEGIETVDANHETGIVTIKTNDEISQETLEETIDNLGFDIIKEN